MIKEYQLRKLQNSYEITLYYKGVKVRVAFTGGNVYRGVQPKFRTDNAFKMKALEASQLFKNKEVVLLRTIEQKGDANAMVQQRRPAIRKGMKPSSGQPESVIGQQDPPADTGQAPEPTVDDGLKAMTFDNLGEAIQYVAQTWQIPVQTEADARRVLKEHGINPRIKKG